MEQIDTQNIELFRMAEDLINAVKGTAAVEDCQKALGFLKDYVIYHFRDEEAYQASIHYSGVEAHKVEHRQFTQTVLEYEKRLQEDDFDKTMQDLAGIVTVWLIYHVVDADQKIEAVSIRRFINNCRHSNGHEFSHKRPFCCTYCAAMPHYL